MNLRIRALQLQYNISERTATKALEKLKYLRSFLLDTDRVDTNKINEVWECRDGKHDHGYDDESCPGVLFRKGTEQLEIIMAGKVYSKAGRPFQSLGLISELVKTVEKYRQHFLMHKNYPNKDNPSPVHFALVPKNKYDTLCGTDVFSESFDHDTTDLPDFVTCSKCVEHPQYNIALLNTI